MSKPKAPSAQFYFGDWRRDLAVQSCSLPARGLWIEMLALMWDGSPRGFLRVGEMAIDPAGLSRLVGADTREVEELLSELERAGVFSREVSSGCIYSRRMVRDARTSLKRAEAGREGGLSSQAKGQANVEQNSEFCSYADAEADASAEESLGFKAELAWRIEEVWNAHLAQWRLFYEQENGFAPSNPPTFTVEIRKSIRAAILTHDAALLRAEQRDEWTRRSKARAAGIGIFLDSWCTGKDRDNDVNDKGKRYLEPWRPWRQQRGKADPVERFAAHYFEIKDAKGKVT